MPGMSAVSLPHVDSAETLTAQAVLEDLSISSALTAPERTPPSPWEDGSDDCLVALNTNTNDLMRTGSRKRNKSDVVNPVSPKRRWGDGAGSEVRHESVLHVFEQIEHVSAPSIARRFGEIRCRILVKNGQSFLTTVSENEEMTLQLDLKDMSLVWNASEEQGVFSLRRATGETAQSSTFVFKSDTSEECAEWIHALEPHCCRPQVITNTVDHTISTSRTKFSVQSTAKNHSSLVYSIPPKITHLILVRHGHYVNAHVKDISDAHQVLSEMGRQQAKLTGEYLQQLYHRLPRHNHISLYHSDRTRAIETAMGISESFSTATPIASSLLREGWPGTPFFADQMPPSFRDTKDSGQDDLDRLDQARMDEAYSNLFTENPEEDQGSFRIVVCHANLIRYFLCRALRMTPQGLWGHFEINHCSVTRIDIAHNRPLKVMTVNETGHLPHSLITSSEDHL